jgi:hypothetical protein
VNPFIRHLHPRANPDARICNTRLWLKQSSWLSYNRRANYFKDSFRLGYNIEKSRLIQNRQECNAIPGGRVIPLCKHLPDAPQSWQLFFDRALSTSIELRPDSALKLFSSFIQHIQ